MKKFTTWFTLILFQCIGASALASEPFDSGKSDIWENPFLAYGYNPANKTITGYLIALRTAPGRTDECKLAFSGNFGRSNQISVKYFGEVKTLARQGGAASGVSIVVDEDNKYLKFSKNLLGGDCDWILPLLVGEQVTESFDGINVAMKVPNVGKWIAVYAISAKRAKFHSRPDSSFVQKAFVVEGDVVYVYEEQPEWYFVKYEEGKRKIAGWIRKSDTIQP